MTWAKLDPTAAATLWDGQLEINGTLWDIELFPIIGGTAYDLNLVVQDNWTKQESTQ